MKTLTLIKPDDWHLHLRDEEFLHTTVPFAASQFARAIVMPNLNPPITDVSLARTYHQKILTAIPSKINFQPLMTLYLTEATNNKIVEEAKKSNLVVGFKLYPAGVTTHSASGVKKIEKIFPALEQIEKLDMILLVHAETTTENIDIFEREKYFLDHELAMIVKNFPQLRIVVEHVSSEYGVNWVKNAPQNIAATLTAHHLLLTRNDLLNGGIRPHYYCAPVVKTHDDQQALIQAAISGNPKFFLGSDSAPHAQNKKESACGCAGIFTGHAALPLYAEVFAENNALDKLEGFASFYGADFYKLPRNQEKIKLQQEEWTVPNFYPYGSEKLIPFGAGKKLYWSVKVTTNGQY